MEPEPRSMEPEPEPEPGTLPRRLFTAASGDTVQSFFLPFWGLPLSIIFFLMFFFSYYCYVYRDAAGFCRLTLCLATLPSLFILRIFGAISRVCST